MSQPQQQQAGGAGGGGPGSITQCCSDCIRSIPLMTRVLMLAGIFSSVVGMWFVEYFYMCAHSIVATSGLGVYRLFVSPLFGMSWSDLFVLMFIWMSVTRLELYRGSTLVLIWTLALAWCTNLIMFVLGVLFEYVVKLDQTSWGGLFCDTGMWSVTMGLMAVDAACDPVQSRRFFCCPIEIRTVYQPIIMAVIMTIFNQRLGIWVALGLGFAFAKLQTFEIRADRLRRWEQPSHWLSCFTTRTMFIAVDRAGQLQPWSFGQPPLQQDDNGGRQNGPPRQGMMGVGDLPPVRPGAGGGGGGGGGSGSGGSQPKSSVFSSGGGHKLGSAPAAAAASPVTPASEASRPSSGSAAGGKAHRPGTGHVLADRLARAKQNSSASAAAATATTAPGAATIISSTKSDDVRIVIGADHHTSTSGGGGSAGLETDNIPSGSGVSDSKSDKSAKSAKTKKKSGKDVELQPMLSADGSSAIHDAEDEEDPFTAGISRLQLNGYSYDDALRAMNACDGDSACALQYLSAQQQQPIASPSQAQSSPLQAPVTPQQPAKK